ncbi:MAG: CsgG/HfaB family protein [Nitrospinaceae bacterium]
MKTKARILQFLFFVFLIQVFIGCTHRIQPIKSDKAQLGFRTQTHLDLETLPPPAEPIIVVVYKFRDQTGQYKPGTDTTGWSTAVTQGATSMMIKALQDAGNGKWFKVLEREALPNLLNERKIINQTRKAYDASKKGRKVPQLPPLLFAPILLDGGVIAYESNLITGGFGARYLGVGANTQYRRDTVTVYLRAVSVKNGQVLKSVTTNKTIFSIGVDAGVFKFVGFQQLLEIETGFTTNEPPQMAVLEAIEKATISMIMEGTMANLWSFADPKAQEKAIKQYLKEKSALVMADFDNKGNLIAVREPSNPNYVKPRHRGPRRR